MIIKPVDKAAEFGRLRKGDMNKKWLVTGFDSFDGPLDVPGNFRLAKSYMSIFTGYPSSGKSEFLDAILINMALLHKWKTIYYSPENFPVEMHMGKLGEKFIGKHIMEFDKEESKEALTFMNEHFTWMDPEEPELDTLLAMATNAVKADGLDCLVIDPWNSVTHHRGSAAVHEYLQEALTKVIRFGRKHNVHVSIVAHPKIPVKDKSGDYPVPDLYSISDGAMWRNKADYGFVIHRPDLAKNEVSVYIQKIKYKWMGKPGMRDFHYDVRSGRFKAFGEKEFLLPTEIQAPF